MRERSAGRRECLTRGARVISGSMRPERPGRELERLTMDYESMDAIREHYGSGPGRHWFDAGTLRFFRCRLPQSAFRAGDVAYFVTSECPPDGRRAYTVRRYDYASRNVRTVGEFCGYASRSGATSAAKRLASAPPAATLEDSSNGN